MGLDMYLFLGKGEDAVEVGYWRKANAIHQYFVNTLQDGEDDQRLSLVDCATFEDLKEKLEVIVNKARELGLAMSDKDMENEEGYDGEDNDTFFHNNTILTNHNYNDTVYDELIEVCENTLPTISGFFFGNTKYNAYYFDQIKYTYNLVKEILNDWEKQEEDYYYTCWW